MKRLLLICIWGFCVIALAPALHATTLSFNLNAALDNNPTPLQKASLVATFDDNRLVDDPFYASTLSLKLEVSGLSSGEYVSGWYFNFDPSFKGILYPDWKESPGSTDKGGLGEVKVGGITFNYSFDSFIPSFSAGTSIVLINSMGAPITVESFDIASSGYYAAAEIQNDAGQIFYLGASSPVEPGPVSEPASMLLLGTGLTGLAFFGRKKFLK